MFFKFPVDGDMLNAHDGETNENRLYVRVHVMELPGSEIYINRIKAAYINGLYEAVVPLDGYRNTLKAYNATSLESREIVVYWLKNATNKFRLSLDDNIWCLQDLAKNAHIYKSIFENPYFALYKKAHDLYQAKVHMNIYYQCDGFDLTMMPEKFKGEFQANSDWFHFAFHAKQNDPPRPYLNTTFDEILHDFDRIMEQVHRFAGQEIQPVTTVHWGECTREGVRALRARGLRCLMGYFWTERNIPTVSYYLDLGQTLNLAGRNFWKDNREDIVFGRIANVLNTGPLKDIIPQLEREKEDPQKNGFMELMIHEQYFYPKYESYLPDYEDRVLSSVKWAVENGYRPAWVSDCVFER